MLFLVKYTTGVMTRARPTTPPTVKPMLGFEVVIQVVVEWLGVGN